MKINEFKISGLRCYGDTGVLTAGDINVLVGANNAGKSSILKAIHLLQDGNGVGVPDIRLGQSEASVFFDVSNYSDFRTPNGPRQGGISVRLKTNPNRDSLTLDKKFILRGGTEGFSDFPSQEPHNLIIPFYSQRKVAGYAEQTSATLARTVHQNLTNLAAKLARLVNPDYPGHRRYSELSTAILGRPIFVVPSANGQLVGRYVGQDVIPLTSMGDGVPHILGLLSELCNAEGKVFLIEEPENDLHPHALKALLDFIIEKAPSNQFFVTTHSNIVVRHLGSHAGSRLFKVRSAPETRENPTPTSVIEAIPDTTQARIEVLRELGYTLSDFELREGWLILEESSAQSIIAEFLIPLFAPKLACLFIVAAGGVDRVSPMVDDFVRLSLYSHLQEAYRRRTWVRVDGDSPGMSTVTRLRQRFADWPEDRFATFTQATFERYYPPTFREAVDWALGRTGAEDRRQAKRKLLLDVLHWLREDRERAKRALEVSAADVIADLKAIEAQL